MTAMHLNSTDHSGRALRARRRTTHGLRVVGDQVQTAVFGAVLAAVAAWMVNSVVGFASVLNVTGGVAILLVLAGWGAAQVIRSCAYDVADMIDPDSRDGDVLWGTTKVVRALAEDVTHGADYDDIRLALQASGLVPALHELTVQLRGAYAEDGEMEEASALSDTVALVRAAAQSLGHQDLGE
ncbi:hypothetical protein [Streptomyces sp. DT195]|uniref:hypothetical protein n=1 Tax=Streptomyces sp. DT195 TaxID=3393419 RepID=UPI003CF54EC1